MTDQLDGRYGYVAAVGNDCCWPLIVQPKVPLFDAGMNFWAFVLHQSLLLYHVHTTYCMNAQKLTKNLLLSLIQEVIEEFSCHDPDSGHFTKCNPNTIYSVLDSNDRVGDEFKGRGTVSKKKKDGTYKLSSKFGENGKDPKKSSGRKTFSGEDISPRYYVGKRYPKKYETEVLQEQWNALQTWLASQDSNRKQPLFEDDDCSERYREGYQKGQQAMLQWIAQYTQATNPKK